jgi:phenylacetate-coenzyme A ligase PaaK-like adenylate-forming protein
MQRRVPELRQDRDEWTLRMMHWHFSQQTGSPFWLGLRDGLPFDPLRDISDFNSLRLFGFFDKNLLRMTAPRDLLPRGLRGKKFRVFETGGTTGEPCRVVNVSKLDLEVTIYRVMLEIRGVEGGDIVAMTPSGPHQYAHFVERLADRWQGAVGFIDFDPRWVKAELRRDASASGYITHLVDQTEILLERLKPSLLYTTSKLLMELVVALSRPLADYGIKAVCTGGTSCSPEESRFLRREYLQNVQWIDTYGNTLVGHALMADSLTRDAPASYYLPGPIGSMRVVDPAHPWVDVPLGQRGRVLTTTLLEDLFLPNLLERDSAIRVGPHPWFPFEGVSAVQSSFEADGGQVVEGLY